MAGLGQSPTSLGWPCLDFPNLSRSTDAMVYLEGLGKCKVFKENTEEHFLFSALNEITSIPSLNSEGSAGFSSTAQGYQIQQGKTHSPT